jgi:hypothetical protein
MGFLVPWVWWPDLAGQTGGGDTSNNVPPAALTALAVAPAVAVPIPPSLPVVAAQPAPGQRAYRLVLAGETLALEAAEDLRGEFRRRRGPAAWAPGMLCCRLLDAEQRVLAQETLPPPDRTCVVLDPHVAGPAGPPQPTVLTADGPVMFQVRLPKLAAATELKVYRLASADRAALGAEPVGTLLGSFPLN